MKLVNVSHLDITIITTDGLMNYPPAENFVEVIRSANVINRDHGFAVCGKTSIQVVGLPEPAKDTVYLVPWEVLLALPERNDIAAPSIYQRNGSSIITTSITVNE